MPRLTTVETFLPEVDPREFPVEAFGRVAILGEAAEVVVANDWAHTVEQHPQD